MARPGRLFFAFSVLLLSFSMIPAQAQVVAPCPFGDDGFQLVDCCTETDPRLPRFPETFGRAAHGVFRTCQIVCGNDVVSTQLSDPFFLNCDHALFRFQMTSPNGVLVASGTLTGKYSRTWQLVSQEGQVWRFLLNGFLEFPQPGPVVTPCSHPTGRVLMTGFVDYAVKCDLDLFDVSWSLHTIPDCLNPTVTNPAGGGFTTHHYVFPRTFTFGAGIAPRGPTEEEAVRTTFIDVWPSRVVCRGEAPVVDGVIADRSFGCLCDPAAGIDWVNQHIVGSTRCQNAQFSYATVPFATPFLPAGAVSRHIGRWNLGTELHRDLTVTYGVLEYQDPCADLRRDFVAGVSTRTLGRLFPHPVLPVLGPVETVFTDLANLTKPDEGSNPFGFVSDIVYNLNPRE